MRARHWGASAIFRSLKSTHRYTRPRARARALSLTHTLRRLSDIHMVDVIAQEGAWLKLAQSIDGQDGWVRKEEGGGKKKGGGLTRKDAALMVKQGKVLGFDSDAMAKWAKPIDK